jgi:hypothetical protein
MNTVMIIKVIMVKRDNLFTNVLMTTGKTIIIGIITIKIILAVVNLLRLAKCFCTSPLETRA